MPEPKVDKSQYEEQAIPPKRYFTIREVSELCDVKTHVLRYWESEFPKLEPPRRAGGRRYYRRSDVLLIRQIRRLLYEQGYTIDGARKLISGHRGEQDVSRSRELVRQLRQDLEQLLEELK